MAKLQLAAGATSKLLTVFVQDSSSTTGAGLTGLVYNTGSLVAYYLREGAGSAVSISLATMTLGTWATGGFIVVDGTNMPGLYQLGIPDAALATGANSVVVMLKGAANMVPTLLEIQLTGGISKNVALANFEFCLVDSLGIPRTGLTVAAQRSIDGGAFGSCTNSVSEVSNGIYKISLSAADLNGGVITLRMTATGAQDRLITLITMP